jgi:hypothetical protein
VAGHHHRILVHHGEQRLLLVKLLHVTPGAVRCGRSSQLKALPL